MILTSSISNRYKPTDSNDFLDENPNDIGQTFCELAGGIVRHAFWQTPLVSVSPDCIVAVLLPGVQVDGKRSILYLIKQVL